MRQSFSMHIDPASSGATLKVHFLSSSGSEPQSLEETPGKGEFWLVITFKGDPSPVASQNGQPVKTEQHEQSSRRLGPLSFQK